MIEAINQQRKIIIDLTLIDSFAEKCVSAIEEIKDQSITIAFVSDRKMKELNKQFRGKNSTTDVLSFPFEQDEFTTEGYLGDIVISAEQARKQAIENNLNFDTEIKQLILHGILHLCGYDHETDNGEMNSKELILREELEIS